MTLQDQISLLQQNGQLAFVNELLSVTDRLTESQVYPLEQQLNSLDFTLLQQQRNLLFSSKKNHFSSVEPLSSVVEEQQIVCDRSVLAESACLLVAGGQGSRLGFEGPKGCYPIFPESHRSLFQLHAERVRVASEVIGKPLPLAIMTSPQNHQETVAFFDQHHNFGLYKEQLRIFVQPELPFLSDSGDLFCDRIGHMAVGPNGNGASLQALVRSGIAGEWRAKGIKQVTFMQVDNPLGDPFSVSLLSEHVANGADVTVRCVKREDPDEPVGILLRSHGDVRVVEYTEVTQEVRAASHSDGSLQYPCANISHYCFSLDFIERVACESWPLHLAHKKIGRPGDASFMAWKFELFIFDCIPFAHRVGVVLTPREECFAPLKNAKGKDGPESVRAALKLFYRKRQTDSKELQSQKNVFERARIQQP